VAVALSRRGALAAHARDELGLDEHRLARPFQAAWTSALSFSGGAALPLLAVAAAPAAARVAIAVVVTLVALGLLGDLGARLGGAPRLRAALRVVAWGSAAMVITSGISALVGAVASAFAPAAMFAIAWWEQQRLPTTRRLDATVRRQS
jgi:VIT1/CCC1 family predicted Fe2+/Mn2+ transporter